MFDVLNTFSDLDSLHNEEFVLFSRDFVSELKGNNDLIEDLKKFNITLQGLFSGTIQTKTTKQVFFTKCSNELIKRAKYDSINEIFLNIESYNLHYLGEVFLKIKAIELKIKFFKNPKLEEETEKHTLNIESNQIISNQNCYCISCGNEYQIERKKLGFNVCIKCSTVKAKTFVDKGFQTREGHKIMSSKGYRNSKKYS